MSDLDHTDEINTQDMLGVLLEKQAEADKARRKERAKKREAALRKVKRKYLIQMKTWRIYGWSPILAARSDMREFTGTYTEAEKYIEKNLKPQKKAVDEYVPVEPEQVHQPKKANIDVLNAIKTLDPDSFEDYTDSGTPRTTKLSDILGRTVTARERDLAFAVFKEQQRGAIDATFNDSRTGLGDPPGRSDARLD